MIEIKNESELNKMRAAGKVTAAVLKLMTHKTSKSLVKQMT